MLILDFLSSSWLRDLRGDSFRPPFLFNHEGHEEREDSRALKPERQPGRIAVYRGVKHQNQLEAPRGGPAETGQRGHEAKDEDHEESSGVLACRKTQSLLIPPAMVPSPRKAC